MTVFKTFTTEDDDGIEIVHRIQMRWEICPTCQGDGAHVHRDIDAGGLTSADFDYDPDFRDDYFSGKYDVQCEECRGSGKVLVPDWDTNDPKVLDLYWEKMSADADYETQRDYERRHGY